MWRRGSWYLVQLSLDGTSFSLALLAENVLLTPLSLPFYCPATLLLMDLPVQDSLTCIPKLPFKRSDRVDWLGSSDLSSVQFSSVAQSCLTLCDPMDCSTPGFPVQTRLPEPTQTHVHHISDAIQPSHPLSSPSPPAFNLSQHQGLFK